MKVCAALVLIFGLTACGIDSEPILGSAGDAGGETLSVDAGAPPGGPGLTRYAGCDRTLHCEAGCAEDFDCEEIPDAEPDADRALDLMESERHRLEAGTEGWWDMDGWGNDAVLGFVIEVGDVTVAVYDDADNLLGRSAPGELGVLFDAPDGAPLVVRAVSGPGGAEFSFFQQ